MLGVPASGRAPDLPTSWIPSHPIPVILTVWRPGETVKNFAAETQRLYNFVQDGLARRWREAFDAKNTGSMAPSELNVLWDRLITDHLQAQQEVCLTLVCAQLMRTDTISFCSHRGLHSRLMQPLIHHHYHHPPNLPTHPPT